MTHTVIVGSGIIGVSTAYYLSLLTSKEGNPAGISDGNTRDTGKREYHIHLVDPAPVLFEHVASGKAGGFLARNWFSPSVAELGALSFDLHKKLAEQFDGRKRWGWSKSTVINLNFTKNGKKDGEKGHREGRPGEYPPWLNSFDSAQPLADRESTAQLDPLRFCNFLLDQCRSRGTVRVHNPPLIIKLTKPGSDYESPTVHIEHQNTRERVAVPCDNLIVTSGPWTSSVLESILPEEPPSSFPVIGSLSGASIVIRSKRWQPLETNTSRVNAVFSSKLVEGFAPEVFSRVGGEIYIAGLNDGSIPPPSPPAHSIPSSNSVDRLIDVARLLCDTGSIKAHGIGTDFEVVSRGLCFRPTTPRGMPVIGRIPLRGGSTYGKSFRLWIGSGHGPWGICLSLGTGMVLSQMVLGRPTSVDVSKLQP